MERRNVRFRDFLPSRIEEQLQPAPMFSPSSSKAVSPADDDEGDDRSAFLISMFSSNAEGLVGENIDEIDFEYEIETPALKPALLKSRLQTPKVKFAISPSMESTDSDDDVFFSPRTTTSSNMSDTPLSFGTHTKTAVHSKKPTMGTATPKLGLLSYENIKQCKSKEELQHIVALLAAEGKYPSLLSAAKRRLEYFSQQQQQQQQYQQQNHRQEQQLQHHDHNNMEQEEFSPRSLQSLYISSDDEDYDDGQIEDSQFHNMSLAPADWITPAATDRRVRAMNNTSVSKNELSQLLLYKEVENLTKSLKKVETARKSEQADYWIKMHSMKESKVQLEQTLQALHHDITATKDSKKELLRVVENLRRESEHLKQELFSMQKEQEIKEAKSQELENTLTQKLKELESDLLQNKTSARKSEQLDYLLKSAHKNLNEMKEERDAMLAAIIDAVGKEIENVQKLTKTERWEMISEFAKEAASSKNALQAMAEALKGVEQEKTKAVLNYRQAYSKVRELQSKCRTLERDKIDFAREINRLTKELSETRSHVKQLMDSANARNNDDWNEREGKYKTIISNLKSQLRKDGTTVPITLYREAVEQAHDLHIEIENLRQKVQQQTSPNDQVERSPQENVAPNSTHFSKETSKTPHSDNITKFRKVDIVKAAGGLKVLQEKVGSYNRGSTTGRPLQNKNW